MEDDQSPTGRMASISEALMSRHEPSDRIETQAPSSIRRRHSESDIDLYGAAISLVILEVYTLCDLPLPDASSVAGEPSEQDRIIAIWTNALIRTVPEDDLRDLLDFTIDHHTKDRAINALDLKRNYPLMLAERARRERESRRAADDLLGDCELCRNERTREIHFPLDNIDVALPCQECRPRAFETARSQYIERQKAKVAPGSVKLVEIAAANFRKKEGQGSDEEAGVSSQSVH